MLMKLHDLTTLSTETPGGEAAKVRGLYLTAEMNVREVVVDMNGLLDLRAIAMPAAAFGTPDVEAGTWPVDITTEAIKGCEPVRQEPESALEKVKDIVFSPLPETRGTLRSGEAYKGLSLDLNEGPVGRVLDIVVDTDTMMVPFVLVETGSWLPDRQVLLPTAKINSINWDDGKGKVDATQEEISAAPDVFENDQITTTGSGTLLTYYGIGA